VVASLGFICAATPTDMPDYPDEQRMFAGANTIAQAADAIFGRSPRARVARGWRASWSRSPRKPGRSRGSYRPCCSRASNVCALTVLTTILMSGPLC
jgi:hypothetical protein